MKIAGRSVRPAQALEGREIDDDFVIDNVTLGSDLNRQLVESVEEDTFSKPLDEIKAYGGISDTVKRRARRTIAKVRDGQDGAGSKQIEGNGIMDGYNLFGVVTPPYNLDYLAKLYTASSPHYAAVNAKTANVVGLGYDFVNSHTARQAIEKAEGDEKKVAKINRKLQELKSIMFAWLSACNDEEEFDEILKNFYIDYESTGNGYIEIGRTSTGEIGYIGHIPATTMRVRKSRDGFVQIIGDKVTFFKHFGKDTSNPVAGDQVPNEVIHFKKYNPEQSFYGVPDIISAMQAVTGNEFAARYNLDYFENKAVPRYVVVIKGGKLGSSGQRDLLAFFDSAVKGTNHRTILVPLPADSADGGKTSFEMKPVEAGVQDSSFGNYHKINLQTTLMAERTPMTKVGLAEGVNLAVARDADKTFKEQVCRPEQRVIDKKFGKIFSTKTDLLRFKLSELTLTDEDTQSKIDERYLRMQATVPNEVRARWGWAGIKGGDKVVDLKANTTDAASKGNRVRDANRSAGATDSASSATGRNTKGDGRTQS